MENNSEKDISACAHCLGKSTCLIENNCSCGTCLKEAKVKSDSKIVVCSVCKGGGSSEIAAVITKNKISTFIVAIVLLVFYFYAAISLVNNENFDKIFPVVGSLTTMIVTFYFSQKSKN